MLLPDSALLARQLITIRSLVQREVWDNLNAYRHLTHHGVDESNDILGLIAWLARYLPAHALLNDAEQFVISTAALLCNIGLQTPNLTSAQIQADPQNLNSAALDRLQQLHPQLSADMIQRSARREPGYPYLGLDANNIFLELIILLCAVHEGQDFTQLTVRVPPSAGLIRFDLLAALLQLSSKLFFNYQRINLHQLSYASPPQQQKWWPYHYYKGPIIGEHPPTIQLCFQIPQHLSTLSTAIRCRIENPIREIFNNILDTLNVHQIMPQLVEARIDIIGSNGIDQTPENVVSSLESLDTRLIPLRNLSLQPPLKVPSSALGALREFIDQRFSKSEQQILCDDLTIDYEKLPGELAKKGREIIAYMERRGRLMEVVNYVFQQRREPFLQEGLNKLFFDKKMVQQGAFQIPIHSFTHDLQPNTNVALEHEIVNTVQDAPPLPIGPLKVGDFVPPGQRYQIKAILSTSRTSNSFVYQAIDHHVAGRLVIVKEPAFFHEQEQLNSEVFEQLRRRYNRELRILADIKHPNIATAFDFLSERYLIQEWIEGVSLRQIIREKRRMSAAQVIQIGLEACDALSFAYDRGGVVHRDIKPEHIILRLDGHIAIIDFGLAKMRELDHVQPITGQSPIFGTPYYMAPEQAETGEVDHRADIFALGVTLYELLSLRLPYERGAWMPNYYTNLAVPLPIAPSQLRPDVSNGLEQCILKSIALRSSDRFDTWDGFRQALSE